MFFVLSSKIFYLTLRELNLYSRTLIIQTSIIQISRLSRLFLWSQFGLEYYYSWSRSIAISFLNYPIEKCSEMWGFFTFQHWAKAVLTCIVTNEEHSNEFWLAQSCIVAKWNFTLYSTTFFWFARRELFFNVKQTSQTFIHDHHVFEVQAIRFFDER